MGLPLYLPIYPIERIEGSQMAGKNTKRFAKVLEPRLAPILRADGFAWQHNGWMRLRDPVINWLDVQSKSDDESCCVNLGVHMRFLPRPGGSGDGTVASDIQRGCCEISYRLTWEDELDHWWSYDSGEVAAADLVACYEERGRPVFERFASFPHPFVEMVPDDVNDAALSELLSMSTSAQILFLARVHDFLGNSDLAIRFCEMGLAVTSKMASGARFAFKKILQKNGGPVPKGR